MPTLTVNKPNLQFEGPTIEVQFLLPAELEAKLRAEGQQIPPPVLNKALIDTGASNCAVQEDIPKSLNLQPVDLITMTTPSGPVKCYRYFMRMFMPSHNIIYQGIFTAVSGLVIQNIHCLVGRDLLAFSEFHYYGKQNQFTLTL